MTSPVANNLPQRFQSVFEEASRTTGTSFQFLLHTAQRESGLQPAAKAPTSSATGLFQFVEQTWLQTMKHAGPELGYGNLSDKITQVGSKYYVRDPDARDQILNLRSDPRASTLLAGALAQQNEGILAQKLNRDPSSGELYAAHFLGANGSSKLIELVNSNPDLAANKVFPQQAQANRGIFYEKTGEAKTVAEVYDDLVSTVPNGAPEKKSRTLVDVLGLRDLFKSKNSEESSRYAQVNEETVPATAQASVTKSTVAQNQPVETDVAKSRLVAESSDRSLENFFSHPGKPLLPSRYGLSYNSTETALEARSSRLALDTDGQRVIEAAQHEMRKSRIFTAEQASYLTGDPLSGVRTMQTEADNPDVAASADMQPLPRSKPAAPSAPVAASSPASTAGAILQTRPVSADVLSPAPIDLVGDEASASVSTHQTGRSRSAMDLTAFLSRDVFKLGRTS
ncbi:transglycosylase SLT domain-containing protein [Cohaesibacter sp. ES.047]|uniref:transglycosylase SLT domain-containing protein n=1 Tax=Cohaesibacter sp. ES.047 TaxID=1798205 RepID=UPI000BB70054|nr:transglycosylase SLT domain-containing protein [Cohaesibacter sp. ES.047]